MKNPTKTATLRWLGLALATVLFAGPAFAEAAPAAPAEIAGLATAPAAQPAPESDAARYGAREAEAKSLEQFAGGHDGAIYIGSGTIVVILLVLIIIILL